MVTRGLARAAGGVAIAVIIASGCGGAASSGDAAATTAERATSAPSAPGTTQAERPGTRPTIPELDLAEIAPGIAPRRARHAVELALSDERLSTVLAANPFVVESVRRHDEFPGGLVVAIRFAEALRGSYPLDVCLIEAAGSPITGIVWLVRDDGPPPFTISAVSPRWGDVACGY